MAGKYYIAVDLEGIACAVGIPGEGLGRDENYRFACRQATREADAAARALFGAGADEVIVWDAHGSGVNLDYGSLDRRCRILMGSGHRGRFVGLDETFTGVLFLGYHAMGGTPRAVLSHTMTSKGIEYYKLGGRRVGELAIDAAYAGAQNVPVLFCASDDLCLAEALDTFGPIAVVETKQSLSWSSALCRHPEAVCEDIFNTVSQAAAEGPRVPPFRLPEPLEAEIRFTHATDAARANLTDISGRPFGFADAFTRTGTLHSVRDLFG